MGVATSTQKQNEGMPSFWLAGEAQGAAAPAGLEPLEVTALFSD